MYTPTNRKKIPERKRKHISVCIISKGIYTYIVAELGVGENIFKPHYGYLTIYKVVTYS